MPKKPRRRASPPRKRGSWRKSEQASELHIVCDEYVVGDVVVGSVEQFEPGGPCFPSKLGTRLGAFKTVKAARAVVERPVFDLRHAPSEGETLDR